MRLSQLKYELDSLFEIWECPEKLSYLWVEGSPVVEHILFSLEPSLDAFHYAAEKGCDLIFTHHPLAIRPISRFDAYIKEKLMILFSNNISLYSAHLPLDAKFNGHALAQLLNINVTGAFGKSSGYFTGVKGNVEEKSFLAALKKFSNVKEHLFADNIKHVAIVTGAGAKSSVIEKCAHKGIDTFVTGEASYHAYLTARDLGVNLIFLGHYQSEMPGLRSFKSVLEEKFNIKSSIFETEEIY